MRKSARILGQECGLSSQEMNHLLKKQGFLGGEPGEYFPTEEGEKYALEEYHKRGTGGYPQYNPHWDTRTWDDTIMTVLDLSADMLCQVRREVADNRELKRAAKEAAALAAVAAADSVMHTTDDADDDSGSGILGKVVLIGVVIGGAIYGGIKAAPHVKRFWNGKVKPGLMDFKKKAFDKFK